MSTGHKITTTLAVILTAVLIFSGYGWMREHDDRIQVDTQQAADQQSLQAIKQHETATESALNAQIDSLSKLAKQVQTPQQAAKALPTVIKLLARVQEVTSQQGADMKRVDSASTVQENDLILPSLDAKPLFDRALACKECDDRLAAAQSDLKDRQAALDMEDQQITQLRTALKRGTRWQRAKSAAKWVAVGAAVGYLASR